MPNVILFIPIKELTLPREQIVKDPHVVYLPIGLHLPKNLLIAVISVLDLASIDIFLRVKVLDQIRVLVVTLVSSHF